MATSKDHPFAGVALAAAAALGVLTVASLVWHFRVRTPEPERIALPPEASAPVLPDWCAPGFEAIPGDGCLAVPTASPPARPLIVYLHGRYAGDAPADEVDRQRRLALRATARGFAVIAFRGRLGQCTASELSNWFCWPSNERNASVAQSFVDGWADALATAHQRVGGAKPYLLGFSNGAYFAGLLVTRGLFDVQAVVVAHGGPVEPPQALGSRPPLLLLSADDDVSQDDMIRFHEELSPLNWAHDSYARYGGHALTDEDIDNALTFFRRSKERLPLDPPLPLHRPLRHDRTLPDAESSRDGGDDGTSPDAESWPGASAASSERPSGAPDESAPGASDERPSPNADPPRYGGDLPDGTESEALPARPMLTGDAGL